ncbi:hypothetical protein [Streptomyces sp. NPDC054765]
MADHQFLVEPPARPFRSVAFEDVPQPPAAPITAQALNVCGGLGNY